MDRVALRFNYLKDPKDIYRQSFKMIDDALSARALSDDMRPVAARLVHACGMPDILDDLVFSEGAGEAGRQALEGGGAILCDAEMVASGITRSRLTAANPVICTLNDPATPTLAQELETTRSAAALNLWQPHLEGAVIAIGNAPTALFRLLEIISDGAPRPALILGFAVGYVGAAESKQALIDHAENLGIAFMTLKGQRGGSAYAAAAVNALAKEEQT